MTHKPADPSNQSIKQSERETHSFEGQEGPGVQFEDGQYTEGDLGESPQQGRTGSYETKNSGGYGTGQPDAEGRRHASEQSVNPPDPEAGQGQGGQ